jgi:tetratricopeptide (TPR) repeat protein/serine phosphatase RsbU (regulator of sigma subunit)
VKKIVNIFLLLFSFVIVSGQSNTDSLLNILKESPLDTQRVNVLIELANALLYDYPDSSVTFLEESSELAKNLGFAEGEARAFLKLGEAYDVKGLFSKSVRSYEKAKEIYKSLKKDTEIGETLNSIGRECEKKGDLEMALQSYLSSLKIRERLKDTRGIASSMNSIGSIYLSLDDTIKAQEFFIKALDLITQVNNPVGIATVLNNLGLVFDKKDMPDSALLYYTKSLKIWEELGNTHTISRTLTNIGNVFYKKEDYKTALEYYNKSLAIKEEVGDITGKVNIFINIGVLYQKQGKLNDAVTETNKALKLAKEIRYIEGIKNCYDVLSELYVSLERYKEAYESMLNFSIYRDTLINENNSKMFLQLREEYEADKREKEIALGKAENEQNQATIKQQTTQIYAFGIGVVMLLVLAVVILNGYRQKRKANILLGAQNIEILKQKEVIEQKNDDIMASITYAKRIQEAILPPDKLVRQNLESSFVLFKPKDIVSGDFYWMEVKQNIVLFSVVDCTGHGVPGAFMSIVGHNGLNQAVNEYGLLQPGAILDKLNNLVELTLHKSEDSNVKDGMDIALCAYNSANNMLDYSGANNPLYIVRKKPAVFIHNNKIIEPSVENDNYALFEIKANRQPIGAYINRVPFSNHTFQLNKEDTVYIFSDGYPDQFGGSDGKKFKYKPFKELLITIQELEMSAQRKKLEETINDWRGDFEQVDDICIIGLRV